MLLCAQHVLAQPPEPPRYAHRASNLARGAWSMLDSRALNVHSTDGHLIRLGGGDVDGAVCGDEDAHGCLLLDPDARWWPVVPMRHETWRGAAHLPHHLALQQLPPDSFLLVAKTGEAGSTTPAGRFRVIPHGALGHYEHLAQASADNAPPPVEDLRVVLRPLAVRFLWLNLHLLGEGCEQPRAAPHLLANADVPVVTEGDATLRARLHYELGESALGAAGTREPWWPALEKAVREHYCWKRPTRKDAEPQWRCRVARCAATESAQAAAEHAAPRQAELEQALASRVAAAEVSAQAAVERHGRHLQGSVDDLDDYWM